MKYLFVIISFLCSVSHAQTFDLSLYQETNQEYLSFEDAKSKDYQVSESSTVNFGFAGEVVWLKIENINLPAEGDYVLTSMNGMADSVTAFIDTGDEIIRKDFGASLSEHKERYRNPLAFDIQDNYETIFIRISSHTFILDVFEVKEITQFEKDRLGYLIFIVFVMGVLLVLWAYNISLYIRLKENGHLFYSLFAFFILIMFAYIEGIGPLYIWSSVPWVLPYVEPLSLGVAAFGICRYSIWLLSSKGRQSILEKLLSICSYSALSLVPITFFIPAILASLIANILTTVCVLLILSYGISRIISKNRYAKYFVFGWSIFMLAALGRNLFNSGAIDYNPIFDILNYAGVIIEALVFTWLISKRIKEAEVELALTKEELEVLSNQLDHLTDRLKTSSEDESLGDIEQFVSKLDLQNYLIDPLSKREEEVLKELATGLTYQQIADKLFISKNTVKSHVIKIYEKLDVKNRTEALNKAKNLQLA